MSRPITTGSKGTTPVSFRLSAAQRKRVEKIARPLGLSAGQFAAMVLLDRIEDRRP